MDARSAALTGLLVFATAVGAQDEPGFTGLAAPAAAACAGAASVERSVAGLDLGAPGVGASQVAELFGLLDDLAGQPDGDVARLYAKERARLEAAWGKELGAAVPRLEGVADRIPGWAGLTWSRGEAMQAAVTDFRKLLTERAGRLGPLAAQLERALAADQAAERAERQAQAGAPDPAEEHPWDYGRAASRLLLLLHFRNQIFLDDPSSPLRAAASLPAELARQPEAGSPWLAADGEADRLPLPTLGGRGAAGEAVLELERARAATGEARARFVAARRLLATELPCPEAEVAPGRDFAARVRRELVRRAALGAGGARCLREAVDAWAASGRAHDEAVKAYLRDWQAARREAMCLDGAASTDPCTTTTGGTLVSVKRDLGSGAIGRLRREIMDADLKADVGLFDLDLAEFMALSAKYTWAVEPSYRGGWQTRVDRWRLKAALQVGDLLEGFGAALPITLNLEAGREVVFARQFPTKVKCATALPYTPARIPFTAKKARELAEGDFVSLPVELRALTGAALDSQLFTGPVGLSARAGVSWLVAGACRLNVLRMPEGLVRVRLTAVRERNRTLSASAGPSFELFGLSFLDDGLASLLGRRTVDLSDTKFTSDLFTWDYVFDLQDQAAADAYESLMKATWRLKVYRGTLPWKGLDHFGEVFASDLRPAEELSQAPGGTVLRMFRGSTLTTGHRSGLKLGFDGLSFESKRLAAQNKLLSYVGDVPSRYLMPMNSARAGWRFLFGYSKEETERTNYAVLPADASWEPHGDVKLVASLTVRDRRAGREEGASYVRQLEAAVGPDLLARLWPAARVDQALKGFTADLNVSCSTALVERMFGRGADDEQALARAFDAVTRAYPASAGERREAEGLVRVARRVAGPRSRAEAVMKLSTCSGWMRGAFIRLLVELAAQAGGGDGLFVKLAVRGKGLDTVEASVGQDDLAELYELVQEITYNVNDNSVGMRR